MTISKSELSRLLYTIDVFLVGSCELIKMTFGQPQDEVGEKVSLRIDSPWKPRLTRRMAYNNPFISSCLF